MQHVIVATYWHRKKRKFSKKLSSWMETGTLVWRRFGRHV